MPLFHSLPGSGTKQNGFAFTSAQQIQFTTHQKWEKIAPLARRKEPLIHSEDRFDLLVETVRKTSPILSSLCLSLSQNWTVQNVTAPCDRWWVMSGVGQAHLLLYLLFLISLHVVPCQSVQINLGEASSFATPILRLSEQHVIFFFSRRLTARGSKLPTCLPSQTSDSRLVSVFTITANKLILSQIYAKSKDWFFPCAFPLLQPLSKELTLYGNLAQKELSSDSAWPQSNCAKPSSFLYPILSRGILAGFHGRYMRHISVISRTTMTLLQPCGGMVSRSSR